LPAQIRFHDLRHQYGTLLSEAGGPLKRAQELMGHASERTTLGIYTHAMRRKRDDSADRIATLAGWAAPNMGNKLETSGDVESAKLAQLIDLWLPGLDSNQRPTD
jgi:Phage integrase family